MRLATVTVGEELITSEAVDPVAVQPFESVTTTVYVPAAAVVTLFRVGLRTALVNPFGPVHE